MLYIEFSVKEDGDSFYRTINLHFDDLEYYSPDIIFEGDMDEIDEKSICEILTEYFIDNDLPEQLTL
jgi:hypothetical protein